MGQRIGETKDLKKKLNEPLILVTGGAGFIGSALIKQLNDEGISNIVIADHLGESEKWKNLVGKKFLEIVEKKELFNWLKGKESLIKSIIHLGACSSTVETNASYLLENNTHFSIKLAEYALENNHRFIYASSAATYGDGSLGFSDEEALLDELRPLNMYGYSKHLFDLWLKNQGVLNRVTGLKYFNVFGPNEWHKNRMSSAVYPFLKAVKNEGVIKLFKSDNPKKIADGEQKRDFIYVKDVVKMMSAFLKEGHCGIYNIGQGIASSWNELGTAVFEALSLNSKIEYIDMPEDLIGKYQNYTCADMKKTKAVLKTKADCTSLKLAVSDMIQNYLLNNNYY